MSLGRMAYYSAVIGGWSAFFAWMICEYLFLRSGGTATWQVVCAAAIIGGAIGAGLNAVAGIANGGIYQTIQRIGPGLIGGGIGGAVGGLLGNLLFAFLGMPRFIGWIIMGLGIGVVEGLYERSSSKIRNGLIGGGLGGLAGGVLFDLLPAVMQAGSGMSSRATGFVILGLCIGALIGLVQVALREAWLTVVDGYRVGRQLILSSPVTVLGRGDHLRLPFVGGANADLEREHLSIERRAAGGFYLRDLSTRIGTFVNNVPVRGEVDLKNGDTIKLGVNFVRFNVRTGRTAATQPDAQPQRGSSIPLPPPPATRPLPPPVRPAAASTASGPPTPAATTPNSPGGVANPRAPNNPSGEQLPGQAPPLPPPAAPLPRPRPTISNSPPMAAKPSGPKLPPPPPKKS